MRVDWEAEPARFLLRDSLVRLFAIPAISRRALSIFRAVLGGSLFVIVAAHPLRSIPLDQQRAYSPLADVEWVRALAASDVGTNAVHIAACVTAAAFAVGMLSRASFALLVAALFVRTLLILLQAGAHDWGTPIVTLLALLVVPWGDAPGILSMWRRRTPRRPAGAAEGPSERRRAYGFAVWLPGLTIGLAFAAAAVEKLRRSGLAWITDGAVRYHFVEDAANAPFELGMWVATQPRLAVLLSLCGILIEALFIGVIFVRHWRSRAIFGLAAAGLMAGFWVFQGVHWWAWLMFLAAFLPWERGGIARATRADRLQPVHALVVAALIGGQVWASSRRIEIEPLFSYYPMYSSTYDSPEYYERAHERLRFHANGTDITDRIDAADGRAAIVQALENPNGTFDSNPDATQALLDFRHRYARLYGEPPPAIEAVRSKRPFDWEAGRFQPEVIEPLGKVDLVW